MTSPGSWKSALPAAILSRPPSTLPERATAAPPTTCAYASSRFDELSASASSASRIVSGAVVRPHHPPPGHRADDPERQHRPFVIADALERGECFVGLGEHVAHPELGPRLHVEPQPRDPRPLHDSRDAVLASGRRDTVKKLDGALQLALLAERRRELQLRQRAPGVRLRHELGCPGEQPHRRRGVAALERPVCGPEQPRRRALRNRRRGAVERPELRAVAIRLLEVVTEDLVEQIRSPSAVEPLMSQNSTVTTLRTSRAGRSRPGEHRRSRKNVRPPGFRPRSSRRRARLSSGRSRSPGRRSAGSPGRRPA
jgi:hypothetical protein